MRYLNRTIIVLVVLSLATANPAPAQTNPEGKTQTFTISGNTGVFDVTMTGLPGDPVTDRNGSYTATVNYGWSGTVTPTREGYSFEPASKVYSNLISDQANDNRRDQRTAGSCIFGRDRLLQQHRAVRLGRHGDALQKRL